MRGVQGAKQMVETKPWLPDKWDKQADVVIVGYGGAGAVAAITVGEAAGKALLLEKAPEPGGSTSTASGGMRYIVDARQAAQFIKNLGFGSIDDETARELAIRVLNLFRAVYGPLIKNDYEPDKRN